MDKQQFIKFMEEMSNKLNINLSDIELNKFESYKNILLEWNEKINLTAITDYKDIIIKHFIDSLTINKYIKDNKNLLDLGTGAGFPGIPLKIVNPNIKITLIDSLNKRITFLNEVIDELKLENIQTIHARAEEAGVNKIYREKFEIVTARAVASLPVLLEYLLPFVKCGGLCICMKGSEIKEELTSAEKALNVLGGKIELIEELELPNTDYKRNIVIVKKIKETPKQYPRKAGKPVKEPIM